MRKNIGLSFILLLATSLLFITCKKDSSDDSKLDLLQLGNSNIVPSDWGIRGFNHAGMPIIHHPTDNLYEWDEKDNTFNKLGNTIPNAVQVANSRVAQDAKGDYYYLTGLQGDVYILNKSTNQWDLLNIAEGYKNKMLVNNTGDILLYMDNRPIGGKESYYLKASTSSDWVKLIDKPSDIDETAVPTFLTDDGLAYFNYASSPATVDGSGIYSDIVLNTKTGTFHKLFDKSEPDNFPVTEGYIYNAFNIDCITSEGVIYAIINSTTSATAAIYKLTPDVLPAKFVKIQDLDLNRLEEDGYLSLRGYKINEATGKVKIRLSCMKGLYSHKNIGIASLGSSSIKILEHDGPQRGFISGPDGSVFVQNYQGYIYKWN
ncbi:MAG: hypothetical protein IPH45_08305 [Bacteroidales bacterium]|nr:hypothetical protein [Bacteroidales bacterium]